MSNVGPEGRSYVTITRADLDRLAELAAEDRALFFRTRADWAALYGHSHFATALCRGAALHYLRGEVGVQDFDVYSFYAARPERPWYAKRNKQVDFGDPKFGRSLDKPSYVGRRVDLPGRGLPRQPGETVQTCIQRWLRAGATETTKLLVRKAVVLLDPLEFRGEIVWPASGSEAAV